MAVWRDEETKKLIEVWGEEDIQAQLEGCTRNKAVYEKISREMAASQYERSAVQCREKIKKLRTEYKKIKDRHNKTGQGMKTLKFYEQLNDIFGHKPTTKPDNVLDTSLDVSEESDSCTTKSLESSSTHDISDGLNDQSEPLEATEATVGDEQEEPNHL